jgi:hypothetical protein
MGRKAEAVRESEPELPDTVDAEQMEPAADAGPREWTIVDHYRFLSHPMTVRSLDEEWANRLRWHLSPFQRSDAGPTAGTVVEVWQRVEDEVDWETGAWLEAERIAYAHDGTVARVASRESVLEYALWDVNATVPRSVRDFLFVHAGSVARNRGGLLLVGSMDAGKSTLVTALLSAGFSYLSDELGAIDPVTARAYPYEKLISLDPTALAFFPGLEERLEDRVGISSGLRQRFVRPTDLGASVSGPVSIRWVVFLEGRLGPARLRAVTHAEAVPRLVGHCFNLAAFDEAGAVLLTRVASQANAFVLEGGTPTERAALLADRLSS